MWPEGRVWPVTKQWGEALPGSSHPCSSQVLPGSGSCGMPVFLRKARKSDCFPRSSPDFLNSSSSFLKKLNPVQPKPNRSQGWIWHTSPVATVALKSGGQSVSPTCQGHLASVPACLHPASGPSKGRGKYSYMWTAEDSICKPSEGRNGHFCNSLPLVQTFCFPGGRKSTCFSWIHFNQIS